MTKLLYQDDSYLQKFEAVISLVDRDNQGVLLNQTAFYPGGGGQPPDFGTLSAGGQIFQVKRVKRSAGNSFTRLKVINYPRLAARFKGLLIGNIAINSCARILPCISCAG